MKSKNNVVISIIKIYVPENRLDYALEILHYVLEPTRYKPGCLGCRAYQDIVDRNALLLTEAWKTQNALEEHISSPEYAVILALIELSEKEPLIQFNSINSQSGIELIYRLRNKKEHLQRLILEKEYNYE